MAILWLAFGRVGLISLGGMDSLPGDFLADPRESLDPRSEWRYPGGMNATRTLRQAPDLGTSWGPHVMRAAARGARNALICTRTMCVRAQFRQK